MAVLLAGSLLAGCGKEAAPNVSTGNNGQTGSADSASTNEGEAANEPEAADDGETERITSEYEALKTKQAGAKERLAFLDANLAKLPKEEADRIMRDMLTFYEQDAEPAQQRLADQRIDEQLAAIEWPITPEKLNQATDEKAKQAIEHVWAEGYKLEATESMIFPIVDYGLLRKYAGALSQPLAEYIALLALESDDKSSSDAGLVITWDQLAEDVKASYEKTVAEHPDTKTGEVVKGFLAVLAQNDWQVFVKENGEQTDVPEVKSYREKALAEL